MKSKGTRKSCSVYRELNRSAESKCKTSRNRVGCPAWVAIPYERFLFKVWHKLQILDIKVWALASSLRISNENYMQLRWSSCGKWESNVQWSEKCGFSAFIRAVCTQPCFLRTNTDNSTGSVGGTQSSHKKRGDGEGDHSLRCKSSGHQNDSPFAYQEAYPSNTMSPPTELEATPVALASFALEVWLAVHRSPKSIYGHKM